MDYPLANNTRPRFADYEDFTFIVDGESRRAHVDDEDYEWGIENPIVPPTLNSTAGSYNPDGSYTCYYTYYVGFTNDKWVETGPSPSASITVDTDQIEWSGIPPCRFKGDYLTKQRRLYRTVSGTAYLVTTIVDNTTTTFSDNVTDATLQTSTAMGTSGYNVPPTCPIDIIIYLQRAFLIKDTKLYWSEAYAPFNFKTTSNVVVTKKENENLVAGLNWGDQVYVVSAEEWYRLQGADPTTWTIKRTFTDTGIINRHTLKKSKFGPIGLWYDGIYLFDGSISKNITEKIMGKKFFTDLSDLTVCYAEFDGIRYYFYYASTGSIPDKCLILDFSYYPQITCYHGFFAHAHEYHFGSGTHYYALDGYEYTGGGTETIATTLITGDRGFQKITQRKCLDYFYYDINTASKDVTIDILVDGTSLQTLTLNTSTRERKRSEKLKYNEGYRFALQISCADSQNLKIYAPWVLEATPVGD